MAENDISNPIDLNKIAADVITDLAKSAAKNIFSVAKSHLKDIKNKDEIDLGIAFEKYLEYAENKFRKVKTLLYLHEPRDLYSFYECIGLFNGKKTINTCDIKNVLCAGHRLIITGSGGMGKSVMMKHFFINCMENTNLVPILVELRSLNDSEAEKISIIDFIYQILNTLNFKLERQYFEYGLKSGCFLILFDGYDEVKDELSQKTANEIRSFCDKYADNYFIVSSRPLQEFMGWNNFLELGCMSLNKKQAISLVKKLDYDPEVKKKFCQGLQKDLYDKYRTFASNPLLLTIMLLTFEGRASIPDKLNDFYEQAFVVLFHEHDATKGSYQRDISCKLGYEDFRMVFSYFCFKSFFKSQYEFTESQALSLISLANKKSIVKQQFDNIKYLRDLTNAVCMLVREGLNYKFAHRSFQEYFAAVYTTQLSDDQQAKFLMSWMKDKHLRKTSDYLDMLYDLQPSRFIYNFIYPGLKYLRTRYIMAGKPENWAIETLGEGIIIECDNDKDCKEKKIALRIVDDYFLELLTRTLNISSYKINEEENFDKINEIESSMIPLLEQKFGKRSRFIAFEELKQAGIYNEVMQCLGWNSWRFNVIMEYLSSFEAQKRRSKLKFDTMLDDL